MGQMHYKDYNSFAMDYSGSISYICDVHTYELLYLSKACMEICGLETEADYREQKCYKILRGLDSPCSFCNNDKISDGSKYSQEHYDDKLNRWFEVTASLIRLDDRLCRLEIAKDITLAKKELSAISKQLSMEDTLLHCLNTLTMERDMDAAVNLFLQAVGGYYEANRAYIIEFDLEQQTTYNTYEWCAPGISAEIDNLQSIPLSVMDHWIKKFETKGEFSINSLDDDLNPNAEDYRLLEAQGIQSLLAVPLRRDAQIVGFIGIDDPHRCNQDLTLLRAVSGFVLEELEKRRLMAELEQMSYIDVLTGLKNRNQYARILRGYESNPPDTLGVIALDINGLKGVNDTHGYEYGDYVLKHVATVLQEQFAQDLYRIGGDEFVVLCNNISKEDFQVQVVKLRSAFDADEICDVAIGFAWTFEASSLNMNTLLQQADEMCHAEKQSYYHTILSEGRSTSRSGLTAEVLREIENNRFLVYYQPQISLDTGKVVGAEALVRKRAEDGSLIPPGKFIPFYEVGGCHQPCRSFRYAYGLQYPQGMDKYGT